MPTDKNKTDIVKEFAISEKDTGSCQVQVALLSARINKIARHLKSFPKDTHSRLGLVKLVGRRKAFLQYIKRKNKGDHDNLKTRLRESGYI